MSQGSIIRREGTRGVSYLLKYDVGHDPATGKRLQRYKTTRGTKKEAETELRRLLTQVDTGLAVDPSKITVAEWAETWLRDHVAGSVSQNTFEGYAALLRVYVIPRIGKVAAQKLTAPTIQKMYAELRTSGRRIHGTKAHEDDVQPRELGLTAQSVLHVHRVLFSCLKTAMRQRVISRNPVEDVTAPNPKRVHNAPDQEGGGRIKALERDQLKALAGALRGKPLYDLVALAAGTGLRRGELLALSWRDVNLEKRTLQVNRSVGVTKKNGVAINPCPKNQSSRRTIGLDERLCQILKARKEAQATLASQLGILYPADSLIFPCIIQRMRGRQPLQITAKDVDFTRPWHPNAVTKDFHRQAEAAGFPGMRFHDLRHTHATQLLLEGVPVHAVAHRLGHSTPVVTMTIYAHVLKRAEDKAAQVAGELLGATFGA